MIKREEYDMISPIGRKFMRKICFFDIDGTISDDGHGVQMSIPDSCIQAMHQAKEAGHLLFINTGRVKSTIPQAIFDLPTNGFVLGCGTEILIEDKSVFNNEIDAAERKRLIEKCKELPYSTVFEGKMGCAQYHAERDPFVMSILYRYGEEKFPIYDPEDETYVFEKFCLFKLPEDDWGDLSFLENYNLIARDPNFYEVTPASCSKGNGVRWLLNYYGLNKEDSYAFGDSENDLEMLKAVGHAIVMGQAPDNIKKQAEYVTNPPAEDGIYRAMVHYGLIDKDEN